ncbi:PQQ-dependent sugar dehydrogenase [Colwellia sp. MEBiC06753]
MLIKCSKWLVLVGALFSAHSAIATDKLPFEQNDTDKNFNVVQITDGVTIPWGMAQLPNGDILVTERAGELRLIQQGKLLEQKVAGLPEIHANRQGGLLDIVLHPNYAENGWLYFTFSSPEGEGEGSNTALMRAKFDAEKMTLTDQQLLYKGSDNTEKGQHYGSRIAFDKQGYVYFSIGDRGERDRKPQDITIDGGKVYRLQDDGRIPADNPFVANKAAKSATFSYGHRNPQGMALNPNTGEIWAHEHGPKGGDEVNLIQKGKNYGWPVISYGINYNGTSFTDLTTKQGMEQPLHYWNPSIAPSGMVFITSDKYPQWQGKLLVGSLKFHHLVLLDITDNAVVSQSKIFEGIGRLRSIMQGQDGYLYVGVDGQGIKRIEPKS